MTFVPASATRAKRAPITRPTTPTAAKELPSVEESLRALGFAMSDLDITQRIEMQAAWSAMLFAPTERQVQSLLVQHISQAHDTDATTFQNESLPPIMSALSRVGSTRAR